MHKTYFIAYQSENSENQPFFSRFNIFVLFTRLLITGLFCLTLSAVAHGQAAQYTNNNKDQSLRGSGRVNASSLAMEFSLPLGSYPGRGINMPINLNYSSKIWRLDYGLTQPRNGGGCYSVINPKFAENSVSGWTTSMGVPFIEYTGSKNAYNQNGEVYYADAEIACDPGNSENPPIYYIRRVTLHLPDGETHELRLSDTKVSLNSTWDGTYYAVDGSNIKYVQNASTNTYKILMPDGSFYEFDTTSGTGDRYANKFTDRNGNYITYHAPTTGYPNGYWTDTLGKNIPIPITPQAPPSAGTQTYSLPGIDGDIVYTLHWKQLKGSSAAESGLTNFSDSLQYLGDKYYQNNQWNDRTSGFMFGSEWGEWIIAENTLFNPIVLTQIALPNGEKYKFTYNVYGEIERIYYPTGGEERFTYGGVNPLSDTLSVFNQANRGVTNRKVYETANTGTPSEWTYGTSATGTQYIVTITNPDNTKNVRFLHRGNVDSLFGFDNALAGMSYREFSFSSTGALQTQKFTYWTKSAYFGEDER